MSDADKELGVVERVLADAVERHPGQLIADDLDWYAFPQTWGSTALGFSGPGGQMMSKAQTFIVIGDVTGYVYFGGKFAYSADRKIAYEWVRRQHAPGRWQRGSGRRVDG